MILMNFFLIDYNTHVAVRKSEHNMKWMEQYKCNGQCWYNAIEITNEKSAVSQSVISKYNKYEKSMDSIQELSINFVILFLHFLSISYKLNI